MTIDLRFWRDASGRLTFDLPHVVANDWPEMCKAVATAFALTPDKESFLFGLDQMAMNFRSSEHLIELAWDNWSGFFVTSQTLESEPLVHAISQWLHDCEWSKPKPTA